MENSFEKSALVAEVSSFRLPRWAQLPELELYMDQLIGYINQVYSPLADAAGGDMVLTKSMVNNYVKQRLLPAPVKKRYVKEHLATLLVLCPLKQAFSIPECVGLMELGLGSRIVNQAQYDAFADALESALQGVFAGQVCTAADVTGRMTYQYAGKVYLQKQLAFVAEAAQAATTVK